MGRNGSAADRISNSRRHSVFELSLNGIPVATLELKNPLTGRSGLWKGKLLGPWRSSNGKGSAAS